MKTILPLLLVLVAFSPLSTNAGADEARLTLEPPDWAVGARWRVKVWAPTVFHDPETGNPQFVMEHTKAAENILDFAVLGVKEVRGENCFEIQVTYPRISHQGMDTCLLYFCVDTRRLVRSVITHTSDDGTTHSVHEDIPVESSVPVWSLRSTGLAVPSFPEWSLNSQGSEIIAREGNDSCGHQIEQKAARDASGKTVICSFTRSLGLSAQEGQDAPRGEEVMQEWESGRPWWTKAKWVKEGNVITEAELIIEGTSRE